MFGGYNTDYINGKISYEPQINGSKRWETNLKSVIYNGVSINDGTRTALLDSGTSYMIMNNNDFN